MVPAAGEDGVVDQASLTVEVACTEQIVTVHVKSTEPGSEVIASAQTFHLRRDTLSQFRLENVFRQATNHAAMRYPQKSAAMRYPQKSAAMSSFNAVQLLAMFANLLRVGGKDAVPPRGRPAEEPCPACRERAELVVGDGGEGPQDS